MIAQKFIAQEICELNKPAYRNTAASKIYDYAQFVKLRLSMLVVFSAVIGFIIASNGNTDWIKMIWLILGGFLVTGSSNGFNQIIERDLDKLMTRTMNRPLPQNRMSVNEAIILATAMGAIGIFILTYFMNPVSGILGASALISYTSLYTPLKRKTPFAVFVGAFPGAVPPLLGCVAATSGFGEISFYAMLLFLIQFLWQFPHFWAIAWVMDEDYKKAGFRMLPSPGGRNKGSSFQIVVYTLSLMMASLLPLLFKMIHNPVTVIIIVLCGVVFSWQAIKLFRTCGVEEARQLMFGSFVYLPIVQLAILFG